MFGRRENARESSSSREFSNLKDTNFLSMTFSGTKQRIGKKKKKKEFGEIELRVKLTWIDDHTIGEIWAVRPRRSSKCWFSLLHLVLIWTSSSSSNFLFFRPPFSCEIFEIYGALKSNTYANLAGPVRTCHVN